MRFDRAVYAEAAADPRLTGQALLTVALAALASSVAQTIGRQPSDGAVAALNAFVTWIVVLAFAHLLGRYVFRGRASIGNSVRALSFAVAPGILDILHSLPTIGLVVSAVVGLWELATTLVAIQESQQIRRRAIPVLAIALVAYAYVRVTVLRGI